MTSCFYQQLEICHGRSIYTTDIGKCYESGFFLHHFSFLRLLICCHNIAMTTEKLYNLKSYITKKFSFLLCRMGKVEVLPHIQGVCFAHSRRYLHTRVCELCCLEWQSAQHCSQGQCEDGMVNTCSCTGS